MAGVLKVNVGGVFVPVIGSGNDVVVQPTEPTGTSEGHLWFDTDEAQIPATQFPGWDGSNTAVPVFGTGVTDAGEGTKAYRDSHHVCLAVYISLSASPSSTLFTLPVGFRPPRIWRCLMNNTTVTLLRFNVGSDGGFSAEGATPTSTLIYGNVTFPVV